MTDTFTTTTSLGKRLIGSVMGIPIGLILFLASFYLIFWNEGRSVDRIKTLDEGRGLVISVSADAVDPDNQGALIHTTETATTEEVLEDALFGVEENALKLLRTVEMYQWKETEKTETEKNMGGSKTRKTTYSYDKVWSESVIDSSAFKKPEGHENPDSMPYESERFEASDISIGDFWLDSDFTDQITDFKPYRLTKDHADAMDESVASFFTLSGNQYMHGDSAKPAIGAMRVSYQIITPLEVSVIGKQDEDSIVTYATKNGEISLLEPGRVDAQTMFAAAEDENTLITWLVRVGALIMMWVGMAMVLGPIKTLGDIIPFIGSLLGAGIGLFTGVIALILSTITMAIAWIVFRPLIGIGLLVLAAVLLGGFIALRKKPKAAMELQSS